MTGSGRSGGVQSPPPQLGDRIQAKLGIMNMYNQLLL